MQEVMPQADAVNEVNKWLDYKRVKPIDREKLAAQVDTLVSAVQFGDATMDGDTFVITQKLVFPLTDTKDAGKVILDKLAFKPRITVGELGTASQGVKATDFDGKVLAYMSALTGAALGYIKKLDSVDLGIGQAIAVFFM